MARKQPVIAAEHFAPGANTGNQPVPTDAGGNVMRGSGGGSGSTPSVKPFSLKAEQAGLITAAKKFFAQSADLGEPPSKFDKDKFYRIQLNTSVQDPAGNWLRPSQDVVVSGEFAATIAEHISGASEV